MKNKTICIFITTLFISLGCLYAFHLLEKQQDEICLKESLRLWVSVNNDYPFAMTSQESYDKNNRQACASMYYVACINDVEINCALTEEEKGIRNLNEVGK